MEEVVERDTLIVTILPTVMEILPIRPLASVSQSTVQLRFAYVRAFRPCVWSGTRPAPPPFSLPLGMVPATGCPRSARRPTGCGQNAADDSLRSTPIFAVMMSSGPFDPLPPLRRRSYLSEFDFICRTTRHGERFRAEKRDAKTTDI